MIKSLQRKHLWIWAVLGVLLPVGFVSAYLSIPDYPIESKDLSSEVAALTQIERSIVEKAFEVRLRKNTGGMIEQVEILIKKPLSSPATVVYYGFPEGKFDKEKANLLGSLGAVGVYRFNLNEAFPDSQKVHLFFYDPIKKKVIHEISI